jgi:hypothetical protein
MGKEDKPRSKPYLLIACFSLGAMAGAALIMRMDEESRRRLRKNLFELREMPFRVYI